MSAPGDDHPSIRHVAANDWTANDRRWTFYTQTDRPTLRPLLTLTSKGRLTLDPTIPARALDRAVVYAIVQALILRARR